MGVAESVRQSTPFLSVLKRSLSLTPKRCSSSITQSPRSLKRTPLPSRRWVPTTTSTDPSARAQRTRRASAPGVKRESEATRTGYSANRSRKVRACWSARMVVGTNTAACAPPSTHLRAARMATSVFPKPTSPTTTRSMGCGDCMSALTSSIARRWSGVSS